MRKKELPLLIVLAVAAVGSLIYGLRVPARRPGGLPVSPPASAPLLGPAGGASGPFVRPKRKPAGETWGRNPFVFGSVSAQSFAGLTLNGILWDRVKPQAIIGGQIVGVGDAVAPGGAKVEDIRPNQVVLDDGRDKIELMLE